MSQPILIDPLELARDGRELKGVLQPADLPRVVESVSQVVEPVTWSLRGSIGRCKRPELALSVSVVVSVVCQRCLQPMPMPLKLENLLTLFRNEESLESAEAEDETIEGMLIEGELDLTALIEDEILLALPFAPRHESCELDAPVKATGRPNPFAVLSTLKTRSDDNA